MEKLYKYLTFAILGLLVVWRIPFLNKGIDYTDTGFNMANYRDFFADLQNNGIGMFMTDFVGSVIYNILPSHQLLVFRILHLMMWSGTFLIIFFTFRRSTPSFYNLVLAAVLLAVSSYQKIGEAIFSYYPFSMLVIATAIYLIYTALTRDKKLRLFIGGVVLGLSVGVRLSNVLFFALAAGVFWYYLCNKEYRKGFARSGIMLGGAFSGLVAMAIFEIIVIGPATVIGSFTSYSNLASSSSQDHGIINQILHIFEQIGVAIVPMIKYFCPMILAGFAFIMVYKKVFAKFSESYKGRVVMYGLVAVICAMWLFLIRGVINSTRFVHIFGLLALVMGFVAVFALMKKHPELSAACVMCIICAGCIVLGTDLGITRFADVLPQLCVLMLISAAYVVPSALKSESKLRYYGGLWFNAAAKTTVIFLTGFAVIVSMFTMIPNTYNDARYDELTTSPSKDIPVLSGMKTTPQRAESFNNLHKAMTENELVGDREVVSVGMFPLIFNIVDNDNYFTTPCIDYNSVSAERLTSQYETKKEQGIHPVVVISRMYMIQTGADTYCADADKAALIDRILSDCEYKLIFSDTYFDVWAPIE